MSHCYRSRCCYGEPTCTTRVVQFVVVAVAMQPHFHHTQKLPSDGVAQLDISTKWLEHVEVCASPSTERVHFYSYDEGI